MFTSLLLATCLEQLENFVQLVGTELDLCSFLPCVEPATLQLDVAFCVNCVVRRFLSCLLGLVSMVETDHAHRARVLELVCEMCHPHLFRDFGKEGVRFLAEGHVVVGVGQVRGFWKAPVAGFTLVAVVLNWFNDVLVRSIPLNSFALALAAWAKYFGIQWDEARFIFINTL